MLEHRRLYEKIEVSFDAYHVEIKKYNDAIDFHALDEEKQQTAYALKMETIRRLLADMDAIKYDLNRFNDNLKLPVVVPTEINVNKLYDIWKDNENKE